MHVACCVACDNNEWYGCAAGRRENRDGVVPATDARLAGGVPAAGGRIGTGTLLEEDQFPIAGDPQAVGLFAVADHDFHLVTKDIS